MTANQPTEFTAATWLVGVKQRGYILKPAIIVTLITACACA
jgi:hypothetical protein